MFKPAVLLVGLAVLSSACAHSPQSFQNHSAFYGWSPAPTEFSWTATGRDVARASKDETKKARKNDVADDYTLKTDGSFWRTVNGKPCQITSNVEDFKVSQHPDDVAMVYFIKGDKGNRTLYVLHNSGDTAQCPKASTKPIMMNVKKYSVTSNTKTTIVNSGLDENGSFVAWDSAVPVYSDQSVADYQMNQCYGAEGKAFNSYVLFTIDAQGRVTKVKVDAAGRGFVDNDSKETSERFGSLTEFKDKNNVCK